MSKKKIVVYVDDDPDDIEVFSDLFTSIPDAPLLKTFNDPDLALEYLQQPKDSSEAKCFVLIDVNLSTYSGLRLVNLIRQVPALKDLRLALITTSQRPQEKQEASDLGVEIIIKPNTVDAIEAIVRRIVGYCNDLD